MIVYGLQLVDKFSISRPDTLYLWANVAWKASEALAIQSALSSIASPNSRNLQSRIESMLAVEDPDEEARLRGLGWSDLLAQLKERTSEEIELIQDTVVEVCGRHFALTPWSPRRGCDFQLICAGVTLHGKLCDIRHKLPNLYLEIGSEPFWLVQDWRKYLQDWQNWIRSLSADQSCTWHVSRVDLATHTQRLITADLDRTKWVCRADSRRTYTKARFLADLEKAHARDCYARETGGEEGCIDDLIERLHREVGIVAVDYFHGEETQMIAFGSRGRAYARIYNKSREILRKASKRALFSEVWKQAGFSADADVFNVEIELNRSWLISREFISNNQSFIIDTLADLLQHYEALRAYFLGFEDKEGWLRMVDITSTRKTRCETSSAWELLRDATECLHRVSAHERHKAVARYSLQAHLPGIVRAVARLDMALGREHDHDGPITAFAIMERMAALLETQFDRAKTGVLSDRNIESVYRAERLRLVTIENLGQDLADNVPSGTESE